MQYMNDPNLGVMKREERGLDVNDITGRTKSLAAGPLARVAPIRPTNKDYDIINPVHNDNKLRMSSYGKNVLDSRSAARTNKIIGSPAAGKKLMPKTGEANIDQIWPDDALLRRDYDSKNRALHAQDVNLNTLNPRMQRLKQADEERIRLFLASKDNKSSNSVRPYKNASNVFVHLVDDPTTRRKLDRNTGRNSCKQLILHRSFLVWK